MPFYKIHMVLFHMVPVVFALFSAWLLARKGVKAAVGWGVSLILALLVLAVAFPSIAVYYNNGPRAAAGSNELQLPFSSLIVLAIQLVAEGRIPLPRWSIVLVSALVGVCVVGIGSYIA